jgi:ABC-2 type transport system permease protein
MNTFTANAMIFRALIARDMKVIKKRLLNMIIDGLILVSVAVLVFGNLLPLLGMSTTLIAPIFLGNSLSFFLASLGYNCAMRMVYDLKFNRFIDYFLTLPLPKTWLFAYYVTSFMIESAIITLPLVTLGIISLGKNFGPINGSFIAFLFVYFCALLFWSLFFLGSSFMYDFQWFKANMWCRRIMPLFVFGPAFFTFQAIRSVIPVFSKLFWLNPLTYVIEGLRASLLSGPDYVPLSVCLLGIFVGILFMCARLHYSIHKQLDPV